MLVPPLYSKKQEVTTVCESSLPEWGGKKPFSSPGTGEKGGKSVQTDLVKITFIF